MGFSEATNYSRDSIAKEPGTIEDRDWVEKEDMQG